jgi:hypothetical protein
LHQATLAEFGEIACGLALAPAEAQSVAPQKPLMSEVVFKNVQVLKGIPVNQFMDTMGFFSGYPKQLRPIGHQDRMDLN